MLRIPYKNVHRKLRKIKGHHGGPEGRILALRELVTKLFREERIEGNYYVMDEARGYAELLIMRAHEKGIEDPETLDLMDFWLLEKDMIHKLYDVLVPRYKDYSTAFTAVHMLPRILPGVGRTQAVLELKGNPWPPVQPTRPDKSSTILNVLLTEAKKDYRNAKTEKYRRDKEALIRAGQSSNDSDSTETRDTSSTEGRLDKDTKTSTGTMPGDGAPGTVKTSSGLDLEDDDEIARNLNKMNMDQINALGSRNSGTPL